MTYYAIDIQQTDTISGKTASGKAFKPVLKRFGKCADCKNYARALGLCGYDGELVHRHRHSGCLDFEEGEWQR